MKIYKEPVVSFVPFFTQRATPFSFIVRPQSSPVQVSTSCIPFQHWLQLGFTSSFPQVMISAIISYYEKAYA